MGGFATLGVQKKVEAVEMEGANLQGIHDAAAAEGVAQHIFVTDKEESLSVVLSEPR